MARVFELVKSGQKKIGAFQPRNDASRFGVERYARRFYSGSELRLAASPGSSWLALVNRTASNRHADQEKCHGSSGEEGEFGVVSTTQCAGDAKPDQSYDEADLSAR
jgi:hypothetical protein